MLFMNIYTKVIPIKINKDIHWLIFLKIIILSRNILILLNIYII